MAAELGVSGNQLVLAWLLHLDRPRTLPIIGFSRLSQLEDNLKALSLTLGAEQMQQLNGAGA